MPLHVCTKQPVNHSAYELCLVLGTLYAILYHIENSVLTVVHACVLYDLLPPDSAEVPWEVTERKKSLVWLDITVEGHSILVISYSITVHLIIQQQNNWQQLKAN